MRRLRSLLLAVATLGVSPLASDVGAVAQTVQLANRAKFDPEVLDRIEDALAAGRYVVFLRDTVLSAQDTVEGDIFLFKATARVAGVVTGQIVGVESELFVRPGAEIRGGVVVLNGGYYGTQMARIGPVQHLAIADYRVREVDARRGPRYRITPPQPESGLTLPGVSGLLLASYERVSALTLPWGIEYRPGEVRWLPEARAVVRYRTARKRFDGEARFAWAAGAFGVSVEAGRATESQDTWITGGFENTLASLGFAADHLNYYEAKFARARVEAHHGRGARFRHRVRIEWEEASGLRSVDPFSLFETEGGFRPNPAITDGRLVTLRAGSELDLPLGRSALRISAFWEVADAQVAGEFTYARVGGEAVWQAPGLSDHTLRVRARGGGPVSRSPPRQRWISLGGYKTLPTLDALSLRGDTHLFVQSTYGVPLLSTGLGDLVAWVQHAVGSAWVGSRPRLDQNVGLGLDFGPFAVWLFADPAASGLDLTPGFGLGQL